MKWIRYFLFVVMAGMLVVRSGVFVARIVKEWHQPVSTWQPISENEQMIGRNYQELDQ